MLRSCVLWWEQARRDLAGIVSQRSPRRMPRSDTLEGRTSCCTAEQLVGGGGSAAAPIVCAQERQLWGLCRSPRLRHFGWLCDFEQLRRLLHSSFVFRVKTLCPGSVWSVQRFVACISQTAGSRQM